MKATKSPRKQSPKTLRDNLRKRKQNIEDQKLQDIASQINLDALEDKPALPVDRYGRVDIDPSHPSYDYWTNDDVE
ncbi:hypothetical protein [Halobacillus campisalis]|uniref:Uncharacterized protein n=1 Tax=Halobacillus campisalis TaxID=435909 RepID=A0ABW2JZH8_9BACI|nr:hypothetical protein [Halobacillus campisalis]